MGVDLMPFSINAARARFLRLGIEFFDSTTAMNRQNSFPVPCVGSSCACAIFPVACAGSGLHMPWLQQDSFDKYISVYPINHFDDEGAEKLVSDGVASACALLVLGHLSHFLVCLCGASSRLDALCAGV
jgi:hypothetical protein